MHNRNHRCTWREFGKRIDPYASFTQRWGSVGEGRYWKRKLSKARRKWTDTHQRGLKHIETICNWKNW